MYITLYILKMDMTAQCCIYLIKPECITIGKGKRVYKGYLGKSMFDAKNWGWGSKGVTSHGIKDNN